MPLQSNNLMAFDYGLRQIGVAVGNRVTGTCQALTTIHARDGIPNWEQLTALINEWQPEVLVVGEPWNMDDTPGELAPRALKFARRMEARFQLPFALVDERLTSFEAKDILRERGHRGNYKDRPADSLAAELILRTWMGQQEG